MARFAIVALSPASAPDLFDSRLKAGKLIKGSTHSGNSVLWQDCDSRTPPRRTTRRSFDTTRWEVLLMTGGIYVVRVW